MLNIFPTALAAALASTDTVRKNQGSINNIVTGGITVVSDLPKLYNQVCGHEPFFQFSKVPLWRVVNKVRIHLKGRGVFSKLLRVEVGCARQVKPLKLAYPNLFILMLPLDILLTI